VDNPSMHVKSWISPVVPAVSALYVGPLDHLGGGDGQPAPG